MIKLYCPQQYVQSYTDLLNNAELRDNIAISEYRDAIIAVDSRNRTFGVLNSNGKFVLQSRSYRYNCDHYQSAPSVLCARHADFQDCDAIYCGRTMAFHFGHFLIEGLSRVWPALTDEYAHAKLVFTETHATPMPPYAVELLKLLGVWDRVLIISKSTRFRRVYVPMQSQAISYYASFAQSNVYQTIAAAAPDSEKYDKIYLSRAKMGARKTYGEETVQHIFEKNGYKIIYPETLSISQQISLIKNCTHLAGTAGTALHLAVFMKPGGHVIQIKRNSEPGGNELPQQLLNKQSKLNFTLIWGSIESKPSGHFSTCPQIIGVTQYLRQFMDDEKFNYAATDTNPDIAAQKEYENAILEYQRRHGNKIIRALKLRFVRIVAMFIPVGKYRSRVRKYLKNKFGLYN